jgi:hypothetical protein
MMPFESKESVGLAPLLTRILAEIEAEQADPGLTRKALAVAELSHLFTKERDTLGTDYFKNSGLAAAYLSYGPPAQGIGSRNRTRYRGYGRSRLAEPT